MARIIFNLTKIQTKIFISFCIIIVFFVLYKTIPAQEFDKEEISTFDLLYYTLLTHMGIHHTHFLNPLSIRARTLIMCHLILGYIIILL